MRPECVVWLLISSAFFLERLEVFRGITSAPKQERREGFSQKAGYTAALGIGNWWTLKPEQNEDTLCRQHSVLRCCPSVAKRGNIAARRAATRNVSEDFQEHFLRPPQMLHAWQNESTCWKHDHVSNVAATMCPWFAGPQVFVWARNILTKTLWHISRTQLPAKVFGAVSKALQRVLFGERARRFHGNIQDHIFQQKTIESGSSCTRKRWSKMLSQNWTTGNRDINLSKILYLDHGFVNYLSWFVHFLAGSGANQLNIYRIY